MAIVPTLRRFVPKSKLLRPRSALLRTGVHAAECLWLACRDPSPLDQTVSSAYGDGVLGDPVARCEAPAAHIRKTPNVVSGIGAFSDAAIPSAITLRVSSGSMIPSSQSRAVE